MADFIKVSGRDIGDIKIYTLSTCGWCKKTKAFLNENGIKYAYIDVDKLEGNETDMIRREQMKFNKSGSFPTIVINDKDCIIGYDEDALRALIGE
jgi:glutaredoxin